MLTARMIERARAKDKIRVLTDGNGLALHIYTNGKKNGL